MTPDKIKAFRRSAYLLIAIGVLALVFDFTTGKPVALLYVIVALVLIGYCVSVLYFFRDGGPD